jgi:hypothetical protein
MGILACPSGLPVTAIPVAFPPVADPLRGMTSKTCRIWLITTPSMIPGLIYDLPDHLVDPEPSHGCLGMGAVRNFMVGGSLHPLTQSTLPRPSVKLFPDRLDFLVIRLGVLCLSLTGSLVICRGWELGTGLAFGPGGIGILGNGPFMWSAWRDWNAEMAAVLARVLAGILAGVVAVILAVSLAVRPGIRPVIWSVIRPLSLGLSSKPAIGLASRWALLGYIYSDIDHILLH